LADPAAVAAIHTSQLQYQQGRYFVTVQVTVAKAVATLAENKDKLDVIQYSGVRHQGPVIV
jgi:hypothetical protein